MEVSMKEMETIEKIKQEADIVILASGYATLQRKGKKHIANHCCPFCSNGGCFTIDSEKQLFHCFSCGQGGDIFTLVMEKENMSFPEAVREIAVKFNIDVDHDELFRKAKEEEKKEDKGLTQEQHDIIKETLRQIALTINNCMESLGYDDDDLNPYSADNLKRAMEEAEEL